MNKWMRQIHRWLSIAFTFGVLNYIVIMNVSKTQPAAWIGLLALIPLILLLLTGLYLFALPYVARMRSRAGAVS